MNKDNSKKPMMAGGFFIALGLLFGAVFGIYLGQPSVGMVLGLVMGSSAAMLVWLYDRARNS